MSRAERLALAVRSQVADIRSEEARRRSSLIDRRQTAATRAAAAQATLDDAMGGYPGPVWAWVGTTEQGLREAVRAALQDFG
jgi:hypothetical protein